MITEIQAGYPGAKAALDIAKGFLALRSEADRNQAIIEIQRHVMDAHRALFAAEQEHAASLKRIDSLEAEIVRMKDWSGQMVRYEARNVSGGAITYMLKAGMENGEEPHLALRKVFHRLPQKFPTAKERRGTCFRRKAIWLRYMSWNCVDTLAHSPKSDR